MSAAPAVTEVTWAPRPTRPARPAHLRLVRPGETVAPSPGWTPAGAPHPDRPAAAPARPPARALRVTRRGRLAISLGVSTVVLALVVVMSGLLPAGASAPERLHTVAPGQTLSQVAATMLPEVPLDRAIVQLQLANGLNTLQVQAGQQLVIPGR